MTSRSWVYADSDGDGKGDPENKILSCGTDVEGYVTNGGDCNDSNSEVSSRSWVYADNDSDGKGDPENKILSCGTDVEGYVTNGGDCDDSKIRFIQVLLILVVMGLIKIVMAKILNP